MSQPVIRVEKLSKEYQLGTVSHGTLTHDLQSWWARMRGKEDPNSLLSHQSSIGNTHHQNSNPLFLALNNVSFDVQQGDAVGIIGRNGAGKSTLLKILSQVTGPSAGTVKIKGRVASLLEVGTGFHPELTGRENVFLNGAILGMTKVEIQRKFDEIVAFAELNKFIDTPVKRYSSGMYVRLAFAVAAHLEPEILIIDEVLAVGDAQFQKKCLGKMQDVGKEGRTVLFVSHNMQAIRALCSRAILLSNGATAADAPVDQTLTIYNNQLQQAEFGEETDLKNMKNRRGSGAVRFTSISVENVEGCETSSFVMSDTIRFRLSFRVLSPVEHLYASVALRCAKTREIITSVRHAVSQEPLPVGYQTEFIIQLDHVNLRPKEYLLYFWLGNNRFQPFDVVDDILAPLTITAKKDVEPGYMLSSVPGYFDVNSKIIF